MGDAVEKQLRLAGFEILWRGKKNQNGPDIWVLKDGRPYSVEVKRAKIGKGVPAGSAQIRPVEPKRRVDDYIAIEFPNGYVLIEPMKDHLRLCSPKGYRNIFGLN